MKLSGAHPMNHSCGVEMALIQCLSPTPGWYRTMLSNLGRRGVVVVVVCTRAES